jgi:signal transduction histidine kinase
MSALIYLRLIGFAAGTLLHLFLVVLVGGYRRPRAFERVLFCLALTLFLFYSGLLLGINAQIYYAVPPPATLAFAVALVAAGLGFLPPLLVHLHAAYDHAVHGSEKGPVWPRWLQVLVGLPYVPLVYFGPFAATRLVEGPPLGFLQPGSRLGFAYGLWLSAALFTAVCFELRFARRTGEQRLRRFHWTLLSIFGLTGLLTAYTYVLGGPRDPGWSAGCSTAVMLAALVPSSLLGYLVLRFNFLEIGGQRNLVYAVSAAFLALLYLSVVRRVETWLEPTLPPEATGAILLFVLVVFFEPLQRFTGRALRRTVRQEVDRLQRLTAEIQQEARRGNLSRLLSFAEARIREEFGLAQVRLVVHDGGPTQAPTAQLPGVARLERFPLRTARRQMGVLEAGSHAAVLSGETCAALEFLAEQLPAAIDLCRLIEEKLALERELAERERLALVGQMAASISHNLKNPLGSMKTVLQVQLENPDLPEALRQDCSLVVAEIDRLSAKLGQLLRFAKPSVRAGGAPQRVAALAVVEQQVALLGREAERRQGRLQFDCGAEDAPCREALVRGSEEALSDVVCNLVVNAIETLSAGGTVRVRLTGEGARLVLEVTDDGPGVPPEFHGKIFQPFFSTKPSGTGLGLAIVERRVAELEGTIAWESPVKDGHGTRFRVTLPMVEQGEQQE